MAKSDRKLESHFYGWNWRWVWEPSREASWAAFHQLWGTTYPIILASLVKGSTARYIKETDLGCWTCNSNVVLLFPPVCSSTVWVQRRARRSGICFCMTNVCSTPCGECEGWVGGWLPPWQGRQGELYFWWLVGRNQTLKAEREKNGWETSKLVWSCSL